MGSVLIAHHLDSVALDTSFFFYEITFAEALAPERRPQVAFAFELGSTADMSYQTGPSWLWKDNQALVRLVSEGSRDDRLMMFEYAVEDALWEVDEVATIEAAERVDFDWGEGAEDDPSIAEAIVRARREREAAYAARRAEALDSGTVVVELLDGEAPARDRSVSEEVLDALGDYGWAASGAADLAFGLEYHPRGDSWVYRVWAMHGSARVETSERLEAATFRYAFSIDGAQVYLYPRRPVPDVRGSYRDPKKPLLYRLDLESGEVTLLQRGSLVGHGPAHGCGYILGRGESVERWDDDELVGTMTCAGLRELEVVLEGRVVIAKGAPGTDLVILGVHSGGFSTLGWVPRFAVSPKFYGGVTDVDGIVYVACDDDCGHGYSAIYNLEQAWQAADEAGDFSDAFEAAKATEHRPMV